MTARPDSHAVGQQQQRYQRQEFAAAVRALLMAPLMSPTHEDFATVRRHADGLREWFARETGWVVHVERDGARLFKRPADHTDTTRGLPDYDRRRYVLLCLTCAVLERAEPQITLRLLGERLLALAAEPALAASGFTFGLAAQHERRELVAVCRSLLELGVLLRVAGDEEGYVRAGGDNADALYDVQRRTLSGMLAAVRGPSTWPQEDAPATLDQRLHALLDEPVADSDEGRRTTLRHHLARRLLDDPVVYADALDAEARAYFANQRGVMATRLGEAAGLTAEQRAEGLALIDETGTLTDVAMPAEGTDAHATLLVADYLAKRCRPPPASFAEPARVVPVHAVDVSILEGEVTAFLREARSRYGRYWRKSAREPGGETELTAIALDRLEKLQLVTRRGGMVRPLAALARFAIGDPDTRAAGGARRPPSALLFNPP